MVAVRWEETGGKGVAVNKKKRSRREERGWRIQTRGNTSHARLEEVRSTLDLCPGKILPIGFVTHSLSPP